MPGNITANCTNVGPADIYCLAGLTLAKRYLPASPGLSATILDENL